MCAPIKAYNDVLGEPTKPEYKTHFFSEYGFWQPLNPRFSFQDLVGMKTKKGKLPAHIVASFVSLTMFSRNGIEFKTSIMPVKCHHSYKTEVTLETKSDGETHFCHLNGEIIGPEKFDPRTTDFHDVVIRVNLNAPKPLIYKRVKTIISLWKATYDNYHGGEERMRRKRLKEYDKYFQVYDLHREGKTLRQIAQIAYPDEYKKMTTYSSKKHDIQPLTEKVKNNLTACQV